MAISFTKFFAISLTLTVCSAIFRRGSSSVFDYPAVFNFGDSNSDTGELLAGKGFSLPLPYGESSFKSVSSGRFCNGRLIVDFLMDAMKMPYLRAYLDSVGRPSFKLGCNYAAGGSTVLPANAASISPFSFGIQVNQFLHFKARVLQLRAQGDKKIDKLLPVEKYFRKGIYMFDIGQNDIAATFYSKTSLDQAIPTILAHFEIGLQRLYEHGARNFWIHSTGPLGCLAQNIATFGTDPSKLDQFGCLISHNQAAKLFNSQLQALSRKLQAQYEDATVTYVDIYAIKLNLVANYSQLGFEQPIMSCCGYGGPPLNYDSRISCGLTKTLNGMVVTTKACNDSSKYVNWDGTHYTEAANLYVSSQILSGKYFDPPIFSLDKKCLSFLSLISSKFCLAF